MKNDSSVMGKVSIYFRLHWIESIFYKREYPKNLTNITIGG